MKRDPGRQREKGPLSHTGDRFPGTSRKRCDTVVLHDPVQPQFWDVEDLLAERGITVTYETIR